VGQSETWCQVWECLLSPTKPKEQISPFDKNDQSYPGRISANAKPRSGTRTVHNSTKAAGIAILLKRYEMKYCVFRFAVIYHRLISTTRIIGKAERGQRGL
jgi:hypothetical protein